jgi:transposase-like protein
VPPLATDLFRVSMTRNCPYCHHPLTRNGSWFSSIRQYHCASCKRVAPLTYADKVKLFDEHTPKDK